MKFEVLMLCTKPRFGVMIQMNLLRYSFRLCYFYSMLFGIERLDVW